MSTDTDGPGDGGERMEKIDVRVPTNVLEEIDLEDDEPCSTGEMCERLGL